MKARKIQGNTLAYNLFVNSEKQEGIIIKVSEPTMIARLQERELLTKLQCKKKVQNTPYQKDNVFIEFSRCNKYFHILYDHLK